MIHDDYQRVTDFKICNPFFFASFLPASYFKDHQILRPKNSVNSHHSPGHSKSAYEEGICFYHIEVNPFKISKFM